MDRQHVEQLFRQHYRRMYSVACSLLYDGQESEDVVSEDGGFTVKCQPNDFTTVVEGIKNAGITVDEENSSVGLVPNMYATVSDVAQAKAINKFVEMLEDLEDVQDVFTNMETTDEVDAALEAEG